jgi:glucoamylase
MSDGWQDQAKRHDAVAVPEAGPGNVALMGELPRRSTQRSASAAAAVGRRARGQALMQPFANHWQAHIDRWQAWHTGASSADRARSAGLAEQFTTSAMVLRTHLDLTYPGPWWRA